MGETLRQYSKAEQISRQFRVHRDPERLRKLLKIAVSSTREESEQDRYRKCAHPHCVAIGSHDRPLDLHHIVPRSQSVGLIDEYTNHIYLCGDFFQKNHHKALHGEETPGKKDWISLGIFGDWNAEHSCAEPTTVDNAGQRLVELAMTDSIASVLLRSNVEFALDYAKKKGVFSPSVVLLPVDSEYINRNLHK